MTLSTYLLYVAAVAVLIVTPGPTMLMCLANAVNQGPARAMTSAAGALLASLVIMSLSALGLGAAGVLTKPFAPMALFLASPASNYVTGTVIPVDGGVSAT